MLLNIEGFKVQEGEFFTYQEIQDSIGKSINEIYNIIFEFDTNNIGIYYYKDIVIFAGIYYQRFFAFSKLTLEVARSITLFVPEEYDKGHVIGSRGSNIREIHNNIKKLYPNIFKIDIDVKKIDLQSFDKETVVYCLEKDVEYLLKMADDAYWIKRDHLVFESLTTQEVVDVRELLDIDRKYFIESIISIQKLSKNIVN